MAALDSLSATALLATCAYYLFSWTVAGRDPGRGAILPLYEPPRGFSPAMLRYIWKERFDDRTFWAAVLSVVSKRLATLEAEDAAVALRPTESLGKINGLPAEEHLLVSRLRSGGRKKFSINMLDESTEAIVARMAHILRRDAVGRWFQENRTYALVGMVLSVVSIGIIARPSGRDEWMALILGMVVMAPGAFYLVFLLLRIRDLVHVFRERPDRMVFWRLAPLLAFSMACLSAMVLGGVVVGSNFGWQTIAATVFLVVITLLFTQVIRAPTKEGRKLLDQIEGFRLFLKSVERWPMDREDAPGKDVGLYEKYLPYAVALDVEQHWSDKLLALAATVEKDHPMFRARSFYLGMWNGNPVEIVFRPEPPRR